MNLHFVCTGENCDVVQERIVTENTETNKGSGTMVLAVFLLLVLTGAIVAMYFYNKRRVANLKTEIARVQYIADPNGSTMGK